MPRLRGPAGGGGSGDTTWQCHWKGTAFQGIEFSLAMPVCLGQARNSPRAWGLQAPSSAMQPGDGVALGTPLPAEGATQVPGRMALCMHPSCCPTLLATSQLNLESAGRVVSLMPSHLPPAPSCSPASHAASCLRRSSLPACMGTHHTRSARPGPNTFQRTFSLGTQVPGSPL